MTTAHAAARPRRKCNYVGSHDVDRRLGRHHLYSPTFLTSLLILSNTNKSHQHNGPIASMFVPRLCAVTSKDPASRENEYLTYDGRQPQPRANRNFPQDYLEAGKIVHIMTTYVLGILAQISLR